MGANAPPSVPAFTAGQILTAQQQTEINTGIPVFATTTTRDAAFGGTGEKTLAEGQFAYIEASDTTQYYDGSTWQTLSVTPGLRYITGASFSAVSSFSLPNSTFTSTYRNYRMLMMITNISADLNLTLRLRAAGSDITAANYAAAWLGWTTTNNATGTTGNTGQTSGSLLSLSTTFAMGAYALDIMSPQVTEKTHIIGQAPLQQTSGAYYWFMSGGIYYNATTSADALSIICSTGNITGSYRIYGYSES